MAALLGGGYLATQKMKKQKDGDDAPVFGGSSKSKMIENVAHCSLGSKAGVSVLRIGKDYLLVGVTPQQVNLLATLSGAEGEVFKMTPQDPQEPLGLDDDDDLGGVSKQMA